MSCAFSFKDLLHKSSLFIDLSADRTKETYSTYRNIKPMLAMFERCYRDLFCDHLTVINDVFDDLFAAHFHSIVQ